MALHLVTGYAGQEHITSADQGAFNMATFSDGEFVFDRGNKFEATVVSNNAITIADGEACMQGRFIKMVVGTTESVTIENGTQGMNRNDLICMRYEKNSTTGVETASIVVKKGTASSGSPTDPEYTTGDITDGNDLVNEMPLYRVTLNGLNIAEVKSLFVVKKAASNIVNPAWELVVDILKSNSGDWSSQSQEFLTNVTFEEMKENYKGLLVNYMPAVAVEGASGNPSNNDMVCENIFYDFNFMPITNIATNLFSETVFFGQQNLPMSSFYHTTTRYFGSVSLSKKYSDSVPALRLVVGHPKDCKYTSSEERENYTRGNIMVKAYLIPR